MFITQYELYDLAEVLKIIRFDISAKYNVEVLQKIITCLEKEQIYDNCIRKELSSINSINKKYYEFCYHNNYYVNIKIYKNPESIKELITYIKILISILLEHSYERAADMAHAIHCLPEIMVFHNGKIPKTFYKSYIKPYEKKWGKIYRCCV